MAQSMSSYYEKRLIQSDWLESYVTLPRELERFNMSHVERSDFYKMPHYSLNSREWHEFEATMDALKSRGKCSGWRIVSMN